MAMIRKENLSVEEVAHWLGLAPRTVYRLVQRGRLPGFKAGNQWRFNQKMLESWVSDQVTIKRVRGKTGGARRGTRSDRTSP